MERILFIICFDLWCAITTIFIVALFFKFSQRQREKERQRQLEVRRAEREANEARIERLEQEEFVSTSRRREIMTKHLKALDELEKLNETENLKDTKKINRYDLISKNEKEK